MAQDSSTSLELGTSENQALITTSSKKTIWYIIASVAMLAVLGGVVALIVVLSGGDAEPTVTTTTTAAPTTTSESPGEPTTPEDTTTADETTATDSIEEPTTPEDPTTADQTTASDSTEEPTTPEDPATAEQTTASDSTEEPTTPEDPATAEQTTASDSTEEPTTPEDLATAEQTTASDSTAEPTTPEEPTTADQTTASDSTVEPTTTEDPTTADQTTASDSTVEPTTPEEPTTAAPPTTPELPAPLDLDEFIEGAFSPSPLNATWSAGGEMLFRNSNGDLVLYDVDSNSITPLIYNSTSQVLQQSSRVIQFSSDGNEVILAYNVEPVYRHSFLANYAAVNIYTGDTVNISPFGINPGKSDDLAYLQNFVWGPSGTALAFVFGNNIYYQNDLNSPPRQITTNGQLDVIYHGIPDWVYEEEIFSSNNAIWFSKDGAKMAYASFDDTGVRKMNVPHYGVPGSVSYQYTQHHEIRYPKSGTANPSVSVTLLDLNTNVLNVYAAPADHPILKTVKFVTNLSIAVVWTNRVQTQMTVQVCTAGQTTCSVIFTYSEPNGWIDKVPLFFNEAGTAFITILPQLVDGALYKQIVQASQPTTGTVWTLQNRVNTAHTVLEILAWNSDNVIWYKATSVADAAEQHIYTVNSAGLVACFTCGIQREDGGECLFNEATLNNAGDRITINCAGPGVPQVLIFTTDGALVRVWNDNAALSSITANRVLPATIRLAVTVSAELPPADVLIQAPADYSSRTNLPLLVYVYGGPDTALVTRRWLLDWGSSLVSRWGIAVAHIDGRGSGLKGVAGVFALNGKLGTVEVEDQITITKFLQDNLSWIDGTRTCIWGWSYGGYVATKALAEGGDVFKCAAAVAPVVDWRFYDTIYTERYMGLPTENAADYAASSLLTEQLTESLRDKSYFLIHGTEDDNVHYQHAMSLSRMLQRQNVQFTQMSYTDEDHGLGGVRPHLYHGLEKFLHEQFML